MGRAEELRIYPRKGLWVTGAALFGGLGVAGIAIALAADQETNSRITAIVVGGIMLALCAMAAKAAVSPMVVLDDRGMTFRGLGPRTVRWDQIGRVRLAPGYKGDVDLEVVPKSSLVPPGRPRGWPRRRYSVSLRLLPMPVKDLLREMRARAGPIEFPGP